MEEKFNALNQMVEVMKISSKLQAGSITNLPNQRSDDLKEIYRLTRIVVALSKKIRIRSRCLSYLSNKAQVC
jgi:hypothetical protein